MFCAAFASRSWVTPQASQVHVRTATPASDRRRRNPIRHYAVSARAPRSERRRIDPDPYPGRAAGGHTAANWLPAPHGRFQIMLRMYWPRDTDPSVLDGSWIMPAVKKFGRSALSRRGGKAVRGRERATGTALPRTAIVGAAGGKPARAT